MTNPTPEQIEAAAVALCNSRRAHLGLSPIDRLPWSKDAPKYRAEASAALVAAAGAAPQEPPMTIEDLNRAFGSRTGGPPSFTAEGEGDEFLFGRPRVPMQVDEAKLAEVIEEHKPCGAPEPEDEAEEEEYQARCGSWDCRAPECGRA